MKLVGLYSGIGGFELGFTKAGFETHLMCDVDPLCQEVLAKRFSENRCVRDVRLIKRLPKADVVVAGFPCQPYSQVGSTKGWNEGKSHIDELCRLIANAKSQPTYVVLENVPFIVHLDGGAALR